MLLLYICLNFGNEPTIYTQKVLANDLKFYFSKVVTDKLFFFTAPKYLEVHFNKLSAPTINFLEVLA